MVKFGDKILFLIKFTPEVLQNKDIYIEREGRWGLPRAEIFFCPLGRPRRLKFNPFKKKINFNLGCQLHQTNRTAQIFFIFF